jgi:2-polyprenyl-3-methyl-5-hydroxy-6-metoxy-1,4-benzoquinol methylase
MPAQADLLACPFCRGGLTGRLACRACGMRFAADEGVARLRVKGEARTEVVRQFYERAPFPGYPPRDSLEALRARGDRSAFARALDQAIPGDARIVEVGCGTGQMSLYLARADRVVVGADLCLASLRLGARAAERFGLDQVTFVETDLHAPGLRPAGFDVVICSGVLHHTPDPRRAFRKVVELARPGGVVVVGLYNAVARLPLRLRRVAARLTGYRWIPFDPVLRARDAEPERREAWLRDQYMHPEEHRHTHAEVMRWFAESGVEYLRAFPSILLDDPEEDDLFAPDPDVWSLEAWIAQLGWMASLGGEGGLFVMIGRRGEAAGVGRSAGGGEAASQGARAALPVAS